MSKSTLYTAVTLDGFIADSNGNVEFLDNPLYQLPDEDYGYASFYSSVDVVVMGYNTYKQVCEFEGDYPYKGKQSVVISTKPDVTVVDEGVEISTESAATVVRKMKQQGKHVWIIGGGATNARLHKAGEIDQLILTYLPMTLGSGVPLFRDNGAMTEWRNTGTRSFPNGLVQVTLERK